MGQGIDSEFKFLYDYSGQRGLSEKGICTLHDTCVGRPPLGYGVNCSYPGFLEQVEVNHRLIMLQANASATDPRLLEGSSKLDAASPSHWAAAMESARVRLGLKIVGGCCGTSPEHLRALVAGWS